LALTRGINNRGDVLGYSFIDGGLENIGVWDRSGVFHTYFVEGAPPFPLTVSNRLCFNDNNLIVISGIRAPAEEVGNSYLVPRPDVRIKLADLVDNLPQGVKLRAVFQVNNHGSMIGL